MTRSSALEILEETSRTFAIPIARLSGDTHDAVASGYLCLRAIDEIEDHDELPVATKVEVLRGISRTLQEVGDKLGASAFDPVFTTAGARTGLPEVTLRLAEWANLAPGQIAPRVHDATATMAERMAGWAEAGWQVNTRADLDRYCFSVAGAVGLLLSDIWAQCAAIRTDRRLAVAFGRGLQSVNIARNRAEDANRGVDFYPGGWTDANMYAYARGNLAGADAYTAALPPGEVREFCAIPLALAHATIDTLDGGREKLSRIDVSEIVAGVLEPAG